MMMSFPKRAYVLVSDERPDVVQPISMTEKSVLLSPILTFACVQCGESNWSKTMYRCAGEKPNTRIRCQGAYGHCWSEVGKWMTNEECQKLWVLL